MNRDLADRHIMITGATDGLGLALAERLGARGARLILHGRQPERLAVAERRARDAGAQSAVGYVADYAQLGSVRAMARAILSAERRVDVLINNAGIGTAGVRQVSGDGHELVFQVDYLAPYLLTHALLPLLERSAPARVVNVASVGQAPIDFANVMLTHGWTGVQAYSQAKLAQISMTLDMAPALAARQIFITAVHPASLMPTKLVRGRYTPLSTIEEGVANVLRLAVDPATAGLSGVYFDGPSEGRAHSQAYDAKARQRLRELTDALVHASEAPVNGS